MTRSSRSWLSKIFWAAWGGGESPLPHVRVQWFTISQESFAGKTVEAILTAGVHNFTCEQGATFRRVITWSDENGVAINLAGSTARMQVRNTHETSSVVLSLSSTGANPAITMDEPNGQITIVISDTVTATLSDGPKVYDLEVVMANQDVVRLLEGQFVVSPEVTR